MKGKLKWKGWYYKGMEREREREVIAYIIKWKESLEWSSKFPRARLWKTFDKSNQRNKLGF